MGIAENRFGLTRPQKGKAAAFFLSGCRSSSAERQRFVTAPGCRICFFKANSSLWISASRSLCFIAVTSPSSPTALPKHSTSEAQPEGEKIE
ncbi:hypothetical protein H8S23_04275 [Anaerofilum sp. BX8]|uniref:Uncharacterized protein n=1 Tax=Anaerofilum hominis TaxID=2763016 RepID=A0A923I5J6_9FIRM|nr:hypothetical protein [Anaerofilum hominis]MBC5580713.1 hypothetical protein [Anaerofilum hominis]